MDCKTLTWATFSSCSTDLRLGTHVEQCHRSSYCHCRLAFLCAVVSFLFFISDLFVFSFVRSFRYAYPIVDSLTHFCVYSVAHQWVHLCNCLSIHPLSCQFMFWTFKICLWIFGCTRSAYVYMVMMSYLFLLFPFSIIFCCHFSSRSVLVVCQRWCLVLVSLLLDTHQPRMTRMMMRDTVCPLAVQNQERR